MSSTVYAERTASRISSYAYLLAGLGFVALLVWGGWTLYLRSTNTESGVPTVKVQQGDVSLSIFARGEVRGGNSQVLTAPMTGGTQLHISYLSPNGAAVSPGDVIVRFNTSDQEFALREAEADQAEALQHIAQATAQSQANAEEDRYALSKAATDLQLAELEVRKNPILPAITARQNDLAVSVARDKLAQLERNQANRNDTDRAGIQIQQAARGKAESKVNTARQNIQSMTLHADRAGYVSIKQNTEQNFITTGMELPIYQTGDGTNPGIAVAEIPDLNHWEVAATIGELDRGHLVNGDKVTLTVIALPNRSLHGHVTDIGGASGGPWDRHFECKVSLDESAPELRPGMSARVEITTETMRNALWLPAQALFESDGKTFVYLRSGKTFTRQDVTLARRNETKVVVTGLKSGQEVALANPADAAPKKTGQPKSALEAISK